MQIYSKEATMTTMQYNLFASFCSTAMVRQYPHIFSLSVTTLADFQGSWAL